MAFKLLVLAAIISISRAGVVAPVAYSAAPAAYSASPAYAAVPAYAPAAKEAYEEPKNYEFGYAVNDPKNLDVKSQYETRKNGVVQGRYSLIERDGSKRIVEYTADPHTGFHAVVHKEPAPVGYEAPAQYAQPAQYSQPQQYYQ